MPQKFAFTTAAMAAALEETPVSYEDLADIERDFDEAETDISELIPPCRVMLASWCCDGLLHYHIRSISAPSPTNTARFRNLNCHCADKPTL